ncbi:MAG: DUF465 domain-containing protein [Thermodesulfobacteriota bacterium]|nr:DUF465 domain-containing protein [Thermodesulfobacteriota bacterium]
MEKEDKDLINSIIEIHPELNKYLEEHADYDEKIKKLNDLHYLTPKDELEKKNLKKLKLAKKDMIEKILSQHRK